MVKDYLNELNDFAGFYFSFTFKGHVEVETLIEPLGMTYKIKVTVFYNNLKLVSASKSLEHYTRTKDVITEFDLMVNDIKEKYKEEIAYKENIMF